MTAERVIDRRSAAPMHDQLRRLIIDGEPWAYSAT